MAKKVTKELATEETAAILEPVTGALELYSVEVTEEGEPVESLLLTMTKGKDAKGAVRYTASCDGVTGKVSASVAAAINDLLEKGMKLLPAAWDVPKNEKEIAFPVKGGNKPPEPESIDDLSSDVADGMRRSMVALQDDFAAYREADSRTRETVRAVAVRLRDLRKQYSKAEFGIFVKLADGASDIAKLLTAKNTLGEFVGLANIPDSLFAMLPEGKNSPKSAQAWVNGLRGEVAGVIVDSIESNADLAGEPVSRAIERVLIDHNTGSEPLTFEGREAASELLFLHHRNLHGVSVLVDAQADGTIAPARDGDGKHLTASLFGTEGADELIKAVCAAFNSYQTAGEKAAIDDMRAKAKAVVSRDFNTLPADMVAHHLFNILSGRINDATEESLADSAADCLVIVDKLQGWFDAIAAGTMTVADVLATGEKVGSEKEAEKEADATA